MQLGRSLSGDQKSIRVLVPTRCCTIFSSSNNPSFETNENSTKISNIRTWPKARGSRKFWKLKSTVVLVIGPVFSHDLVHTFEENGSAPTTLSGYGILSRFKPKKTWKYTCYAKSVLRTRNTNCMQRYTTWHLNILRCQVYIYRYLKEPYQYKRGW